MDIIPILTPTGGLYLSTGKHVGILTYYQTKVKKKRPKRTFLVILSAAKGLIKTKASFAGLKWLQREKPYLLRK